MLIYVNEVRNLHCSHILPTPHRSGHITPVPTPILNGIREILFATIFDLPTYLKTTDLLLSVWILPKPSSYSFHRCVNGRIGPCTLSHTPTNKMERFCPFNNSPTNKVQQRPILHIGHRTLLWLIQPNLKRKIRLVFILK